MLAGGGNLRMKMTEPTWIQLINSVGLIVIAWIQHLNGRAVKRVEKATNGLLKDRDEATKTIAHAQGRAEALRQRKKL